MTRRHRPARQRAHPEPAPQTAAGIAVGWCSTDIELPGLKDHTEFTLIDGMGDRRTSPVRWTIARDRDARDLVGRMIDAHLNHPDLANWQANLAHYEQIAELVADQGGWVVVASALARIEPAESSEG